MCLVKRSRPGSIFHKIDAATGDLTTFANFACGATGKAFGGDGNSCTREFTFHVSVGEMATGRRFTRRILVGPFHPANDIDHGDPAARLPMM